MDMPPDEQKLKEGPLWSNPVIASPGVLALVRQGGDPAEIAKLEQMIKDGLIVEAVNPQAKRAELASLRPGYQNRAMRRADKRK
jgi:hypothetical protein